VGEIYDLATDPGEFDNLWDDQELRADLLLRHFDAFAQTGGAGVRRTADY
jgi:hypothetical protein